MICNECETVAHCLKNGCVPKQPPSKDEALKLALEALETLVNGNGFAPAGNIEKARKAITAIKQALSDATNLAAPVQQSRSDVEPVARVHTFIGPEWAVVQVLGEFNLEDELYTTPPAAQRQWVGLTDEERDALWYRFGYMELMRAIEAKLREKNT